MGGIGLGGLLLVLVLSWVTGVDFLSLLGGGGVDAPTTNVQPSAPPADTTAAEEKTVDLVDAVMGDAQAMWQQLLGNRYQPTTRRLFRDAIHRRAASRSRRPGRSTARRDHKVYLDLGFFGELSSRFGAPGDFAQAYVLAHELGHHVQTLLGIEAQVRQAQSSRPDQQNALSVRARAAGRLLRRCLGSPRRQGRARRASGARAGDVEEGLRAAAAIGDDRLQRMQRAARRPGRFTHGSSEQRVTWFRRGLESGDVNACDTFR